MSQLVRLVLIVAVAALVGLGLFGAIWFVVMPGQSSLAAATQSAAGRTVAVGTTTPSATKTTPSATKTTPSATKTVPAAGPGADAAQSPLPEPATPITAANVNANVNASAAVHGTALVAPQLYTYQVVAVYPHDPAAFTQGLIVRDGVFIEGTGREGQSTLRRVDIPSGKVLEQRELPAEVFGEGITELDGKLYQLSWRNQAGFVYDLDTLAQTGQFAYTGEGWGITTDGRQLIVSDGTQTLQFWDPQTLQPTGGIVASLLGFPLTQINELEYIDGQIFANIWQTNLVVRIDPATGNVTGVVDLGGLLDYAPPYAGQPDVLNGIAYDAATGRLFVTGKLWPAVFEIELVEVPPQP